MRYKLSEYELAKVEALQGLATEVAMLLGSRHEALQLQWDEATERWQESERGEAVAGWLNDLESYSDEAQALADLELTEVPHG